MEIFKLLDLKLIAAQMLCFALVLVLMKKFLWKPVFNILEERRRKVEEEIRAIEAAKVEAQGVRAQIDKALAEIDETARKRLKEVEHLGEQKARELRDKARTEANQIIDDARSELRFELVRSREALKGEIVEMVIKVTEQMIQEKLTFDEDRKIIDGLLTELEKAHERPADR